MKRPLKLTADSLQVIADWRASNPDTAQRRRLTEVVETLEDGSWYGPPRWHYTAANPDFITLRPGESLQVVFHIVLDEDSGAEAADIPPGGIDTDPVYNEPFPDTQSRVK